MLECFHWDCIGIALGLLNVVHGDNWMALNYIDVANGDTGMALNYIDGNGLQ